MTDNRAVDSAIHRLGEARQKILDQLAQVIVGQNAVIEELLISSWLQPLAIACWKGFRDWQKR